MEFDEFLKQNPEFNFSIYTHIQALTVRKLGQAINKQLDTMLATEGVVDGDINEVYGQFWLWVIGTYEIIRTMSQAKKCFSTNLNTSLALVKANLSKVRMPFAKQEYIGKKKPIRNEASISSFNHKTRDFAITIGDNQIWVRNLIGEFDNIFKNMEVKDIVGDHRSSYS
jgi:hypothetical protein